MGFSRRISGSLRLSVTSARVRTALTHVVTALPSACAAVLVSLGAILAVRTLTAQQIGSAAIIGVTVLLVLFYLAIVALRVWISHSDEQVLRDIDRRLDADGHLIVAFEFENHANPTPFIAAAKADATTWIEARDLRAHVREAFPVLWPRWNRGHMFAVFAGLALIGISPLLKRRETLAPTSSARVNTPSRTEARNTMQTTLPKAKWKTDSAPAQAKPKTPEIRPTSVTSEEGPRVPSAEGADGILNSAARDFFRRATSTSAAKKIADAFGSHFTGENAPKELKAALFRGEREAKADSAIPKSVSGEMPGKDDALHMPEGGGADLGLKFDPAQAKQDFLKSKNPAAELGGALQESFNQYLAELAKEIFQGMKEGLKSGLQKKTSWSTESKSDSHSQSNTMGPTLGSKEKLAQGDPTSFKPGMSESVGGTSAGGTGAGAGDEKSALSREDANAGTVLGDRLQLRGTLSERLAVVDVIQKIGRGPNDAPLTREQQDEWVRQISKDALDARNASADVPDGYQAVVNDYFTLVQRMKDAKE